MAHAHGTFQAPTSVGTQTITGLGFQPSCIIITGIAWGSLNADLGNFNDIFGYSDGINEYCINTYFDTSGSEMRHEAQNLYVGRHTGGISSTATDIATIQSFNADGFTINWTTKSTTQFYLSYIVLQDIDDSNIILGDIKTSTGLQAYTGAGFQPTHVIILSSGLTSRASATGSSSNILTKGISDGTDEISAGITVYRNGFSNKVFSQPRSDIDATRIEANIDSLDSDGFTLNFTQVTGAAVKFTAICLSIPFPVKIGYTQKPASTGIQSITTSSFTPSGMLLLGSRDTVLGQSAQIDGCIVTGHQFSTSIGYHATARNGTLSTKQHSLSGNNSRLLKIVHPNGLTVEGIASFTSFNSNGFTLDWTTADSSTPYYGYVLFGSLPTVVLSVTSVLNIVQDVETNFKVEVAANVIAFAQLLTANVEFQRSASNTINFLQKAGLTWEESIETVLTIAQDMYRSHFVTSVLSFTQLAVGYTTKDFESILDIEQLVQVELERNRNLTTTLQIRQILNYYIDKICVEKDYSPFSGEGGVDPTVPTLSTGTLTLDNGVDPPLVLKNPEFGNTDSLRFSRINRTNRGGNLILYADPSWPREQVMILQISGLKDVKKTELQTFLLANLGAELTLTDHHARDWVGIILNPDTDFVQDNIDSYSVTLQFEGVLA